MISHCPYVVYWWTITIMMTLSTVYLIMFVCCMARARMYCNWLFQTKEVFLGFYYKNYIPIRFLVILVYGKSYKNSVQECNCLVYWRQSRNLLTDIRFVRGLKVPCTLRIALSLVYRLSSLSIHFNGLYNWFYTCIIRIY